MRVGWGAVMMEVGRGQAGPPQRPRGEDNEGRASRVPPARALPEKAGHSSPFKASGLSSDGAKGDALAARKAPFLLGCRIFPGWRVSGEGQGSVLQPAGRSVPNAQKSPQSGRCPISQAGKVGKAPPRNPSSAHLETPTPGRVCSSSPVINYRTQGGICKPRITNSTGLK